VASSMGASNMQANRMGTRQIRVDTATQDISSISTKMLQVQIHTIDIQLAILHVYKNQ